MTALQTSTFFFVTGGTLSTSASSYVVRQADTDLYESLLQGEFCYVLNSRQMGKSSLMVRTAEQLKRAGRKVAVLDLQAIGQNLSVEQWYDGLLVRLGKQVGLEDELEDFWDDNANLGPLQRFFEAIRAVALPACPNGLVVFVDELDIIRTLPFSADEFFMGIRECYVGRATDADLTRLTFCLIGTATPADLIQDTRTSPFNIGKRIEVRDFTPQEAKPLANGLNHGEHGGHGEKLLERVLYWTGGHPYLTQRLCRAVAAAASSSTPNTQHPTPRDVDNICTELFLTHKAKETDDNLAFVRQRILKSEADVTSLLNLYARVRAGKRVADDSTNGLCALLRLSGAVREEQGVLRVRNRIYKRVFDRQWVNANMPDAELLRQRAIAQEEARKRRLAEERESLVRRLLYTAEMNLVPQAWEDGNIERAQELLMRQRPEQGQEDLRGFEWRYLWRLCQDESLRTFQGHTGRVYSVALSPDSKTLATAGIDHTVNLWDAGSGKHLTSLNAHTNAVLSVAFSPRGEILASGSLDNTVKLWNITSLQEPVEIASLPAQPVGFLAFSPDGQTLVIAGGDKTITLWNVERRKPVATLRGHTDAVICVAFSPDGKILASGSEAKVIRLWDAVTGKAMAPLPGHRGYVSSLAFSPDGKTLVSRGTDNTSKLWNVAARKERASFGGTNGFFGSISFSPDGKTLAIGNDDNTIRLWDVGTLQQKAILRGHKGGVLSVAFSREGKRLVSGSVDGTAKLWDVVRQDTSVLIGHNEWVNWVSFSPDGKTLASCGWGTDNTVRLWDVDQGRAIAVLRGHGASIWQVKFSPDGKTLASAAIDHSIKLWNVTARREKATFHEDAETNISITFSPEGRALAAGIKDGTVNLWDVERKTPVAAFQTPAGVQGEPSFSPDGKRMGLLLEGPPWMYILFDVASRRRIATFKSASEITSVSRNLESFADTRTVAMGTVDKTIALWDIATQQEPTALRGHLGQVSSVALSPDGKTLASGSWDSTIKLWNVALRQEVATLKGHTGPVLCVAFSPDGNTLVSSSGDGTVRLWRAASFAMAQTSAIR